MILEFQVSISVKTIFIFNFIFIQVQSYLNLTDNDYKFWMVGTPKVEKHIVVALPFGTDIFLMDTSLGPGLFSPARLSLRRRALKAARG